MNAQHAHRLAKAISTHGQALLKYLDEFVRTGLCPSAQYLYVGDGHILIAIDPYDVRAIRLDRIQALSLTTAILRVGLDAYAHRCAVIASREVLLTNVPVAALSRSFDHRPSHLHRSGKTRQAKLATAKGRERDERRASDYRATCSKPYMTPAGRLKDVKPVTIHTPRPTGRQSV